MTHIPLHIRSWFGEQAIFPTFFIKGIPRLRPVPVEGLVDTGSPWLALSPRDCETLNIQTKTLSLPSENIDIRMAGIKFKRMLTGNVEIVVLGEKGNPIRVKMPYVSVLAPTKQSEENVPSVVGMDFIRHSCFSLHYDHKKAEAYFEAERSNI